MPATLMAALSLAALLATPEAPRPVHPLGRAYADFVRKVNTDHARKPGKAREDDLARKLPPQAKMALDKLLGMTATPEVLEALLAAGEAALDLALAADFERIEARLRADSPEHARKLGAGVFRARFVVRGIGDFAPGYLERFADLVEGILNAYDEVFGFEEWSKVPGKKLRFRVHLEEKITNPPHFAPQFPFHSEVDFPVADRNAFRSPTPEGQFLFYGLCHELGHVIAMWGDGREEDHHAWAHYTGIAIVEHLSRSGADRPFLKGLGDVRWRSIEVEKKRLGEAAPSLADRDGVLALLLALHDQVGPRAIGAAMNALDREDRRPRLKNGARYYGFKELKGALLQTVKGPDAKRAVAKLIPDKAPR